MGQYYLTVFLAEPGVGADGAEHIRATMNAHEYGSGVKLMEHSWVGNKFVSAVEHALCPDGAFYKSRIVWAGDYSEVREHRALTSGADGTGRYADVEPDGEKNLHALGYEQEHKQIAPPDRLMGEYRFIVNHTKKQYVDKDTMRAEPRYGLRVHPLPILTAEGNGAGGGDYRGRHEDMAGLWARDVISVEKEVPAAASGYTFLECDFFE